MQQTVAAPFLMMMQQTCLVNKSYQPHCRLSMSSIHHQSSQSFSLSLHHHLMNCLNSSSTISSSTAHWCIIMVILQSAVFILLKGHPWRVHIYINKCFAQYNSSAINYVMVGKILVTISKRVELSANWDMQSASVMVESSQSICWIREYYGWFNIIHWNEGDNGNAMINKSETSLSGVHFPLLIEQSTKLVNKSLYSFHLRNNESNAFSMS